MDNYIQILLLRFQHIPPNKPTHAPYPHLPPTYGQTKQYAPNSNETERLSSTKQMKLQALTSALLYYARAVDNKILVILGTIATKTHAPAIKTKSLMTHLLNYVSTYPNDGLICRKSKMQLAAYSDAGYLNKSNARSCASAHIYMSENVPIPYFNRAILIIANIMKYVMSLAAEAELVSLFITAKNALNYGKHSMKWVSPNNLLLYR